MYYGGQCPKNGHTSFNRSVVVVFAFIFIYLIVLSLRVFDEKKCDYGVVRMEFSPYSLTTMLGGLDSIAKYPVCDTLAIMLMDGMGVQHSHIALAQMKLESGYYQSDLAKNNNNYFGMKHPAQRATVSMGSKGGYAYYRNWAYSILDYALWQKRYAYDLTEDEYLKKIGRVYAEDERYIRKVKSLINKK